LASGTPIVHFRDDILALASWSNVFFEIWMQAGTVRHFRTLRHHLLSFSKKYPQPGACTFSVVQLPSLTKVETGIREEAVLRAKEFRPYNKASVLVLESKGFAGSLIRGIVTSLSLIERSAAPSKTFESIAPASEWLARYVDSFDTRPVTGATLRDVYEEVRRQSANVGSLRG
jgi:hypothetical protein